MTDDNEHETEADQDEGHTDARAAGTEGATDGTRKPSKLIQHFSHTELVLKALYRVSSNAGHGGNKGTAREDFVRVFLEKHLGRQTGIGQGEILDCQTRESDTSPQVDVVLYDANYPKIDFGGNVSGYLAESVIATIEIKSTLDEKNLLEAFQNAVLLKQRTRSHFWKQSLISEHALAERLALLEARVFQRALPPSALQQPTPHFHCYLLAYDGPAKMTTVDRWLPEIYRKCGLEDVAVPWSERCNGGKSPALDGIFVLGRGAVLYENMPFTLLEGEERMQTRPWTCVTDKFTSLWHLFMRLQVLQEWSRLYEWDVVPYFTSELPQSVLVQSGPPKERKPRKPREPKPRKSRD